jgi:catechol 2,3-dioxygenase-like lactoylglutathione lyase family enzyme
VPTTARWTHIAVPVRDIDASVDWYTSHTPLTLIARRHDAAGQGAWLADPATTEAPMVLVLVCMDAEHDRPPVATMAPFAHIGIELPERADVDRMAARGVAEGCLRWEAQELPVPIGYICALADPDGNMVEFSHGQNVEAITNQVWASGQVAGNGPRPTDD